MNLNKKENTPGSPSKWYELGVSLRQREQFGEAVNAFRNAVETASVLIGELSSCLDEPAADNSLPSGCGPSGGDGRMYSVEELQALKSKAEASIELILRIRGFVNKDLMNP